MAVGTQQHEIFDFRITAFLWPINDIFESRLPAHRHLQTDRKRLTRSSPVVRFLFRQIAIGVSALVRLSARAFSDVFFYGVIGALFFRREVSIRFAFFKETLRRRAMFGCIRRLKHDLFIVVEPEPLESLDDGPGGFISGALEIGVFDAQEKLAAGFACVEPIEKRGTSRANVQVTGRRWSEADANTHKRK